MSVLHETTHNKKVLLKSLGRSAQPVQFGEDELTRATGVFAPPWPSYRNYGPFLLREDPAGLCLSFCRRRTPNRTPAYVDHPKARNVTKYFRGWQNHAQTMPEASRKGVLPLALRLFK